MSERSTTTPNRLKAIIVKSTAIAATAGAGALSLTGCAVARPGLDDFSKCDPSIASIHIKDNAIIRSEPTTDRDSDGPSNTVLKVEFGDDDEYAVDEFLNVPQEIGGACIRVARNYGGDANGTWFGVPAAELAQKVHDKDKQESIKNAPDGYVWVNEARAETTK